MKQIEAKSKKDYRSVIVKFLTDEDPSPLTSDQERVLARWEFADLEMRLRKDYGEVMRAMMEKFGVSQFTANSDIFFAQEVFGRSRRINKKYLLHHHLEDIQKDLIKIRKGLFADIAPGVPGIPDAKEIAALAKLNDSLTYALNSLPEDPPMKDVLPPVFVFNLPAGQAIASPVTFEEAMKMAEEYIDYEMLPPDEIPE